LSPDKNSQGQALAQILRLYKNIKAPLIALERLYIENKAAF